MKTPPLISGSRPLMGHLREFKNDRFKLFTRGFEEVGPVFSLKLGPRKIAVIADPELAGQYFKETDKSLNLARAQVFFRKAIGDVGLVLDHETYINERPTLYAPFSRSKMITYLEVFNQITQSWLDSLGQTGTINLPHELDHLTRDIIVRCIMGPETHQQIGAEFLRQVNILTKNIDPMLPPRLPHPKNIRRNKARKALIKDLTPILNQRKKHPDQYNDMIQDFLNTPFKDGKTTTDEQVLSYILLLLHAGHETTAGQVAWSMIHLLQHPVYLEKVLLEVASQLPDGSGIDAKSLARMPHLKWAIDETTRLCPSADQIFRVTDSEYRVGAFSIPKNWRVILGVGVLQRHPDYVTQPSSYDPMRFSPERMEQRSSRYLLSGFGAGIHKCAGMSFAQNEMMAIIGLFLQQFELELVTKEPVQVFGMGLPHPSTTLVKYRRKETARSVSPQIKEEAVAAGCPHFPQSEK